MTRVTAICKWRSDPFNGHLPIRVRLEVFPSLRQLAQSPLSLSSRTPRLASWAYHRPPSSAGITNCSESFNQLLPICPRPY
ncbi:hypothetical protein ABBQ38_001451 [Trebouxia sp. C0009 RCD-2024]